MLRKIKVIVNYKKINFHFYKSKKKRRQTKLKYEGKGSIKVKEVLT